jgi:allantoin racemase
MRLLLINPNTSGHITERMAASARRALTADDTLQCATASGQPTVVRDTASLALADANALALAQAHADAADAILLGISLDGAAPLLRAHHPALPVVGMTEAALLTACLRVQRVGLLTLGPALLPLYRQRVAEIGLPSRVVAYEAPQATQAFEPAAVGVQPDVLALLADAGRRLQAGGAQAIVLAGAVLCGYAEALTTELGRPVFDGVACAVGQARVLLACQGPRSAP